ncbi:hypothetical protein AGR1A_pAt20483 [Agrobacterium fabacearum CFBP 5771]|nr:hypothetical protein AGR1A_pAt20483 [Agrobacterium fabacearum CFBP 5771]
MVFERRLEMFTARPSFRGLCLLGLRTSLMASLASKSYPQFVLLALSQHHDPMSCQVDQLIHRKILICSLPANEISLVSNLNDWQRTGLA